MSRLLEFPRLAAADSAVGAHNTLLLITDLVLCLKTNVEILCSAMNKKLSFHCESIFALWVMQSSQIMPKPLPTTPHYPRAVPGLFTFTGDCWSSHFTVLFIYLFVSYLTWALTELIMWKKKAVGKEKNFSVFCKSVICPCTPSTQDTATAFFHGVRNPQPFSDSALFSNLWHGPSWPKQCKILF